MHMFPPRFVALLAVLAALFSTLAASAQVTVAQDGRGDFNGTDEQPILAALAKVRAAGGGELVIHSGVYALRGAIELKAVRSVTFRGLPGAILKLPPLQHAEASADVAAGETVVPVRVQQGFAPGMLLQIMAPGAVDSFSGKTKPTFFMKVAGVEASWLVFEKPLPFPVPAKTQIVNENAPNLFDLRGACEDITFQGLIIDGGRTPEDPPIPGHAQRCGIFASGAYDYAKGPTGPPLRGLVIRDCKIRNCFGRGVALYAVTGALVEHCTIEDTLDEAVDLDHFTVAARVLDNQVARCRVGVEMNDANECWIARNRFEECQTGVIVWRWCKQEDLNVRNQIVDNLFVKIAGNALQFEPGTAFNVARGNIIRGTGRNGISLSATETVVRENVIENTAMHGIVVAGDGNEISANRVRAAGSGAAEKVAGLRLRGANNRVLDNLIFGAGGRDAKPEPVADDGRENLIRTP